MTNECTCVCSIVNWNTIFNVPATTELMKRIERKIIVQNKMGA